MEVHLGANQLVKLLKKVPKNEPTGTNEIKNQNTSSMFAEARSLCTYRKFKEFKRLLHLFPSFCINWFLHHTVTSYPSKTWTLVSTCFLERCLSGTEKKSVFPLAFTSQITAECRDKKWELNNWAAPQCHSWKLHQDKTMRRNKHSTC